MTITLTKQIDPLHPRAESELAAIGDWQFDETCVVLDASEPSGLASEKGEEEDDRDDDDDDRADRDQDD